MDPQPVKVSVSIQCTHAAYLPTPGPITSHYRSQLFPLVDGHPTVPPCQQRTAKPKRLTDGPIQIRSAYRPVTLFAIPGRVKLLAVLLGTEATLARTDLRHTGILIGLPSGQERVPR